MSDFPKLAGMLALGGYHSKQSELNLTQTEEILGMFDSILFIPYVVISFCS